MSLRRTVATPFRQRGVDQLRESEFVVALSLDRDWFSPDQAQRLVDAAVTEGLLERDGEAVAVTFDTAGVTVPDGFVPDESVIQQRSVFERVLGALLDAGVEKRDAVAGINQLQAELDIAVEAAALLYARRQGVEANGLADRAREEL
ncbi:MAG: hypothetical protein ACI9CA_001096 [Natronomonas sp.]|jgi:hypothetical protein